MKHYLLSVHMVEGVEPPSAEEMQPRFAAVDRFNEELKQNGNWVFAGGLHPVESATVVTNTNGEGLITDGPFSESKEQIGGFWIVLAADLDGALELAKQGSFACGGPVEVRPFQENPQSAEG